MNRAQMDGPWANAMLGSAAARRAVKRVARPFPKCRRHIDHTPGFGPDLNRAPVGVAPALAATFIVTYGTLGLFATNAPIVISALGHLASR
jgi:hypothetical protein